MSGRMSVDGAFSVGIIIDLVRAELEDFKLDDTNVC